MAAQLSQARITNLRWLIRQEGSVTQLATKLTISPIYIFNVLDGQFTIGDAFSKKIENTYGYPLGWMDDHHDVKVKTEAVVPILTLKQTRQLGVADIPEENTELQQLSVSEQNNEDDDFLTDMMNVLEDSAIENGMKLTPEQKAQYLLTIEKKKS